MNLSHNQIYGEIPNTINVTGRPSVYLGSNNLKGPLPRISSDIRVLDLSNNFLSGDISRLLCPPMGVQNSLTILRLGRNLLSEKIPNCWSHWQSLEMIELGSKNLCGKIPSSIGSLHHLQSLHLRNNSLSGEIPLSLQNCKNAESFRLWLEQDYRKHTEMGLENNTSQISWFSVFVQTNWKAKFHRSYVALPSFKSWMLLTTTCLGPYQVASTISKPWPPNLNQSSLSSSIPSLSPSFWRARLWWRKEGKTNTTPSFLY